MSAVAGVPVDGMTTPIPSSTFGRESERQLMSISRVRRSVEAALPHTQETQCLFGSTVRGRRALPKLR